MTFSEAIRKRINEFVKDKKSLKQINEKITAKCCFFFF